MRQRIGFILCISGIVLLFEPNFDMEQMIYTLNYGLTQYWPVGLILLGFMMMQKKQTRRSNKR